METKFLSIIFDLILPIVMGILLKFQQQFKESFFDKMITLSVFILYPVLSVLTFWVLPLSYEFFWLPVLGVVMAVTGGIVAWWQAQRKFADGKEKGSYIIAAMMSNILTLGGLCVYILFGEKGFAYTNLVQLMQTIILFGFCYPLAQYYCSRGVASSARSISVRDIILHRNQIPVLGIIAGIALYLSGISRPAWAAIAVDPLVHIGAWTALIPVGYSIVLGKIREYGRIVFDMVGIKFIIVPAVTCLVAWLVIEDNIAFKSVVVLATTPTAVNAVIAAKINGINVHVAMAAFILTTTLFLLLVYPALFLLLT